MFVFQKKDSKYEAWAQGLADLGIRTAAIDGSPMKALAVLLRMIFSGERIQGYVFRYLNDYSSTTKTLLRFISELGVIAIVKMVRGKVFWIAHNVDRESVCHHPIITRVRRRIVSRVADVTFVTDPLLRQAARDRMKDAKAIGWLCFGRPKILPMNAGTQRVRSASAALRERLRQRYPAKNVIVGLCVSSASPKCTHFLSVTRFVESYTSSADVVGVVVVGPVGQIQDGRFAIALGDMRCHEQVELIDDSILVSEHFVADEFEFFYRVIDDLSVSFSVYVAASVRKPLVTERGTFLADMVQHYELGVVVDSRFEQGPLPLPGRLKQWKPEAADRFLAEHSWTVAAQQFAQAISSEFSRRAS